MTSVEIIGEIKRLPLDEQNKVIEFVQKARTAHPLGPEELGQLTRRMVDAKDNAEAARLQERIVQAFYGKPHA